MTLWESTMQACKLIGESVERSRMRKPSKCVWRVSVDNNGTSFDAEHPCAKCAGYDIECHNYTESRHSGE